MATQGKSQSTAKRSPRTRRTGKRNPLVVQLLKQDLRQVEDWFDEYEPLDDDREKLALADPLHRTGVGEQIEARPASQSHPKRDAPLDTSC